MKTKRRQLAMHAGTLTVSINGIQHEVPLPDGCEGILLIFRSKKAARAWWGKDVILTEILEGVRDIK